MKPRSQIRPCRSGRLPDATGSRTRRSCLSIFMVVLVVVPTLVPAFSPQPTRRGHCLARRQGTARESFTQLYNSSPERKRNVGRKASSKSKHEPKPAHPNDPRAYRRNRRILRELNEANYKRARQKVRKRKRDEKAASAAFDLPEQPLVRTIGGGTAMIFAMAQRMFEQQQEQQVVGAGAGDSTPLVSPLASPGPWSLPRWRPAAGIANVNPSFRTASPTMNNQGYAGIIWRNVRKRNKPSMYRYALRTYDRMTTTSGNNKDGTSSSKADAGSDAVVKPTNIHHEGALMATAKLGLWERAVDIYSRVQEEEAALRQQHGKSGKGDNSKLSMVTQKRYSVHVTEHMVGSVVRACVRAARNNKEGTLEERREPLDEAAAILAELPNRHDIYLDAHHVNPLAAAYQSIGLRHEATQVLDTFLGDRIIGPEPETGSEMLNINDLGCKDKASYALRVQGAVSAEDWGAAVEALTTMTEAGLYPVERHLNVWTEVSERKTKHRTTRSWKKKRDQSWLVRTVPSKNVV